MRTASKHLCLLLIAAYATAGDAVPLLGSKDFYPSPERPLGYRGDGNAWFPGATPVTSWWEGTPGGSIAGEKGQKLPAFKDSTSKNLVWKTPLPGWGDSQPLPVGDRIFVLCDPYLLVCVGAADGKILWQREVLPLACEGKPEAEAKQVQVLFDIARASIYLGARLTKSGSKEADPVACDRAVARVREWKKIAAGVDQDPAILGAFDRLVEQIETYKGGGKGPTTFAFGCPTLCDPIEKKYRLRINYCWYGHLGYAESTPASDGERVYIALPQGQVAAYDLNGNRVWAYRFTEAEPLYAHHLPSPQICGGKLLVRNITGDVAAFDARSGKKFWETEIGKGGNHGSYMDHKLMRIPGADGKPVDILISNKGKILRVEDGAIIGEYMYPRWNNGHGPSLIARDDLFYTSQSHDAPSTPYYAFRVKFTDRDHLNVTEAFRLESVKPDSGPFGNSPVVLTDRFITGWFETWDRATGKRIAPVNRGPQAGGGMIIAGRYGIYVNGGNPYGRTRPDHSSMVNCTVIDFADPAAPKVVTIENFLGNTELPADIPFDRYMIGFDKLKYLGGYSGIGSWFGARNGGPYPSGNRVFIQSATHLYCVGDPAVPYDWNPASRPESITRSLL